MSELEIIIIVSFTLFIALYVVIRNHNANNDKKNKKKDSKNYEEKVAKAYYSSMKPKDYNDKQVLTKYNRGTYRNEKGQYASLKK